MIRTKLCARVFIIALLVFADVSCSVDISRDKGKEYIASVTPIEDSRVTVDQCESTEPTNQAISTNLEAEPIPPGEYLIYFNWNEEKLHLMSIHELEADIPVADRWGVFSPDAEFFALVRDSTELIIIKRQNQFSTTTTLDVPCRNSPSWSNDKNWLALECDDNFIYVFSRNDQSLTRLTNWGQPSVDAFLDPAWSPNGEAIAFFYKDLTSLSPSESNGIYITEVACLYEPSSCKDRTIGPFLPYSMPDLFSWSPDSRKLAIYIGDEGGSIKVIDIETAEESLIMGNLPFIDGLTWTLDNDRISYSIDGLIYQISVSDGEPELLAEDKGYVVSWIEVFGK